MSNSSDSYIDPAPNIRNSAAVTEIFGRWPSFHDGEIVRLAVRMIRPGQSRIQIALYAFLSGPDTDAHGYYTVHHRATVVLAFYDIVGLDLNWSEGGNTIFGLSIDGPAEHRTVEIVSAIEPDLFISFACADIEVLHVKPLADNVNPDWTDANLN